MAIIYVTGHRNPDMDSICSAYSYAFLKNLVDRKNKYIPVRLGSANKNAKELFSRLNIELPMLLKDVKPKVREVVKRPRFTLKENDSLYRAIGIFSKYKATVLPVFDEYGKYAFLLTSDDINAYFLRENNGERLKYQIYENLLEEVLKGSFLKRGDKGEISAPLMVGAMEFSQFERRLRRLKEKPILVTGIRKEHLKKAIEEGAPGIVITGYDPKGGDIGVDFSSYEGFVFISKTDTAETIRLLRLSTPVKSLFREDSVVPEIQEDMLFDEAKAILMMSEYRGLSVFRDREWVGFVTRRCFLERPKQKLILVDHNESEQSVIGVEDAEIVEIIDHHRLAPPRMKSPIYICSEPLGSTCTIIYEQFKKYGLKPDKKRAEVLISGLISDTVMLKSPTTTAYDRHVAEKLQKRAEIEDLSKFSEALFSSGTSLSSQDPIRAIESDMKTYFEHGVKFSISQIEVTSLEETLKLREVFLNALKTIEKRENLDWAMLLVTDVINDESLLLTTGYDREGRFFWEREDENTYSLPKVLSRKKQLLPEILRILEE